MAVTILPNGSIRCDTPEEAARYTRLLHRSQNGAAAPVAVPPRAGRTVEPPVPPGTRLKRLYLTRHHGSSNPLTGEQVGKLRELVAGSSKEVFLKALAASLEGLMDEELWRVLGLKKNEALAGITGALKKASIKAGIGEEFIVRRPAALNGRVGWRFALSQQFRDLMKEVGWIRMKQPLR